MSQTIDLDDVVRNGTYFVDAVDLDALAASAHARGHLLRRISLVGCHDKDDLLQRIASSLTFPEIFGKNWDALADCLGDLAWLPPASGYVWMFDHAEDLRDASEPDFDTLCDILDDACKFWKQHGTPCFAFFALPDESFSDRALGA